MIQGWNILTPDETKPVATLWAEQFDRVKIPAEMYPQLLDRAIDIRRDHLRQGKQLPPLSIELMLAAYDAINAERNSTYSEWERMKYLAENNGPREN